MTIEKLIMQFRKDGLIWGSMKNMDIILSIIQAN